MQGLNTSASRCSVQGVGLYLAGIPGEVEGRVAGVGNTGGLSGKAVRKEGSHNITSHFSLYHANLFYSFKIKEVRSVISPGS